MRPLLFSLALLFVACTESQTRPPPSDRFIYPSGIVHRPVAGSSHGVLYVSSANFDRCYDQGTVMAVDLDKVTSSTGETLPPIGAAPSGDPVELEQLNLASGSRLFIQSYAGEMAFRAASDLEVEDENGAKTTIRIPPRLFIPARSDGDFVHYININESEPARLSCQGTDGEDCTRGALSLSTNISGQTNDVPRAYAPFGVSIDPSGNPWVTHLNPADSPAQSRTNYASYVVALNGSVPSDQQPSLTTENFYSLNATDLPLGGSNSVVADERYVFVSGRYDANVISSTEARRFLLRVVDKTNKSRLVDPGLDLGFAANDARGIALTPKASSTDTGPRRMYIATRTPDSLVTVSVTGIGPESESPSLSVVGAVPLPNGPTEVALVPRGSSSTGVSHSELVVVSCSTAGVVAIYDPDVGQVVAQVAVGETRGTKVPQPFGLAVQQQGNAARVFVSNFSDGRISVIDISDLSSPQSARLVAHIGARQDTGSSTCQEVSQ
ncbi:hypothetical protein [Archangium sp.]|uniref:hypothetical protein n=1 Tax=Archangium sp. TaxID=1872627 RepID=UPI00389987EE